MAAVFQDGIHFINAMYTQQKRQKPLMQHCLGFVATDYEFIQDMLISYFIRLYNKSNIKISQVTAHEYIAIVQKGQNDLFGIQEGYIVFCKESDKSHKIQKEKTVINEKSRKITAKNSLAFSLIELVEQQYSATSASFQMPPLLIILPPTQFEQKMIVASAICLHKTNLKPWDRSDHAIRFGEWYIKQEKLQIDRLALDAVYEIANGNFFIFCNELDKIIAYCMGRTKISLSDVQAVCAVRAKANMMKLLDEIFLRSKSGVIRELAILEQEETIYPIALLRFLKQQIRIFLDVITGGKSLPYKSKTYEKRLQLAKEIGVYRLEEWCLLCTQYEISFRSGEESDSILSSHTIFLLKIIS